MQHEKELVKEVLDDQVDSHVPRFASAESDSEDANFEVIQTVTKDTTSTGSHPAPAIPMPLLKTMSVPMTGGPGSIPPAETPKLVRAPPLVMKKVMHTPSPTYVAGPDMPKAVVHKEEKFMRVPMMGGPGSTPPLPVRKMETAKLVTRQPLVMQHAVVHHIEPLPIKFEKRQDFGGPGSIPDAANLAQVSGSGDGLTVLTRLVIPSVLALVSTIVSYNATNMYFAKAAAGG